VSYAREQHDDGALDGDEVAAIESLPGWSW
jgi:hypothetical protein